MARPGTGHDDDMLLDILGVLSCTGLTAAAVVLTAVAAATGRP